MAYERQDNGVRARHDGLGDPWADQHRKALGKKFYLQDIDGYFGFVAFCGNTGDKLFMEHQPDDYANKDNSAREFAVVALFDRKQTEHAVTESRLSSNFYRWLCRSLQQRQPVGPRFFYVVGGSAPPWTMLEMNVTDGREIGRHTLNSMNWREIWETTGLAEERRLLRQWLLSGDRRGSGLRAASTKGQDGGA
jgi:hypothetical protein